VSKEENEQLNGKLSNFIRANNDNPEAIQNYMDQLNKKKEHQPIHPIDSKVKINLADGTATLHKVAVPSKVSEYGVYRLDRETMSLV
jgi:hypothetical protein